MDFSELNLNLLTSLDAILNEPNLTHAGAKLQISQAAMSYTLKKLRELLGDQLLVRGQASKMILTPFAESLKRPVREAIEKIEVIFSGQLRFDPLTTAKIFQIGTLDYISMVLLPVLLKKINQIAPKVQIVIHHLNYLEYPCPLESGKLDLAIGNFENASDILFKQKLFVDKAVCAAHKTHPAFKKDKISLEAYAEYPHILVGLEPDPKKSFINSIMKQKGYNIQVAAIVPHTLTAIYSLLPHTLFIASTLEKIAKLSPKFSELSLKPMPFKVEDYSAYQYWHPRLTDDPAHQWLRELIKEAALSLQ